VFIRFLIDVPHFFEIIIRFPQIFPGFYEETASIHRSIAMLRSWHWALSPALTCRATRATRATWWRRSTLRRLGSSGVDGSHPPVDVLSHYFRVLLINQFITSGITDIFRIVDNYNPLVSTMFN
jgi:hypothetical protein